MFVFFYFLNCKHLNSQKQAIKLKRHRAPWKKHWNEIILEKAFLLLQPHCQKQAVIKINLAHCSTCTKPSCKILCHTMFCEISLLKCWAVCVITHCEIRASRLYDIKSCIYAGSIRVKRVGWLGSCFSSHYVVCTYPAIMIQ